jgi:alginate O-acetyltransferase complex protein AlgI
LQRVWLYCRDAQRCIGCGAEENNLMSYILYFLISSTILLFFADNLYSEIYGILTALSLSLIIVFLLAKKTYRWISYILFFAISITSFFGYTEVLTGSHAVSDNFLFYGLSFYTASIAYLNSKRKLTLIDSLKVSNPLLIFTGPIALFVRPIAHRSVYQRILYFLPFSIIGIFYFQIVGAPLSAYMFLIHATDLVSALTFAFIFEIFVYANFCGLSLIVYSISGILGYKLPLNFRQPFSATNVVEFWKGWHTSLSSVLKELFYTPARKVLGSFGALLLVYFSSAMWHGITFNFLVWGVFHALCFYITVKVLKSNSSFKSLITFLVMIFGVVLGRLIFADNNTSRLLEKLTFQYDGLNSFAQISSTPTVSKVALILGLIFVMGELLLRNNKFVKKRNYKHLRTPTAQLFLLGIIVLLAMNVGGDYAIYGQR